MNVKKILVPIKGDSAGDNAFRLACGLAKEGKAQVYALYVIEVQRDLPVDAEVETTEEEAILDHIEAVAHEEKCPVEAEYLQARCAGPAIVQEALQKRIELIVLGISHKRQLGTYSLGETATYVLKDAPCPVIIWREQARVATTSGF